MSEAIIYDPEKHGHLLSSFVDIHKACIEKDYTIATFLPPLQYDKMLRWYQSRAAEVVTGERAIIMSLKPNSATNKDELAGFVMLSMPWSETGPYRGAVEKLLVSPNHRQKGVAKLMMKKIEDVAWKEKRTLLVSSSDCLE